MIENIYSFFAKIFENNAVLATIIISMVPIIEIKGAIPFSISEIFWGNSSLSLWQGLGWSILGCSLIVPILTLVYRPIINLLKKNIHFSNIGSAIENFIINKSKKLNKSSSAAKLKKMCILFIFVAIPLPLTGVWTGTCIASCMNLGFINTCSSVILGNIVAGIIIVLTLSIFPFLNNYLFLIFIAIILTYLLVKLIIFIKRKKLG